MEIIIINLTRMGDVIQSTPLLLGLKDKYPGCKITYLANEPYSEISKAIPYIDNLLTFDMEGYQDRLLLDKATLVGNYRILEDFLKKINVREFDLLINLTPSRACAILTFLIRAKDVRGLTIDNEGHRLIKDPWMRYLGISVFNRSLNPFNLVDLYSRIGGVGQKGKGLCLIVPESYDEVAARLLADGGIRSDDIIIGFQPGASKEHKMWLVQKFAKLGAMIAEGLDVRVVVFGSEGEKDLGREIKEFMGDKAVDLVGKTTLMELAALLKRCAILVTNDSGTMHIAAAVGTRIIELSLGAAYFRETGPYGEGHIVIESNIPCHPCDFHTACTHMVCREYITEEGVYKVMEMLLNNGANFRLEDSPGFWERMQVYKSGFDAESFVHYTPLISQTVSKAEIFLSTYYVMWKVVLGGYGIDNLIESSGNVLSVSNIKISKKLKESLLKDIVSLKELIECAENGIITSKEIENVFINTPDKLKHLCELNEKVSSLDKEIERIGFLVQEIKPIIDIFKYGKEGLEGDDILSLARGTFELYRKLKTQGLLMVYILEWFISDVGKIACNTLPFMAGM